MASHEERTIQKILARMDHNNTVLDIGCGLGNKMRFLQELGFTDLTGVEKNEKLVQRCVENGLKVYTPEQFTSECNGKQYDVLLFSHIIEHFQYQDLKVFLENYFRYLKPGGYVLFITPVLNADFFDDFDHVKPYGTRGLVQVFGNLETQVQFYANHRLALIDIRYVKLAFALKYFRALTLRTSFYMFPRLINRLLHLVYRLSFRTVGRTVSWVGLFRFGQGD